MAFRCCWERPLSRWGSFLVSFISGRRSNEAKTSPVEDVKTAVAGVAATFERAVLGRFRVLLAIGLISGIAINRFRRWGRTEQVIAWSDPVIWSSGILFAWLLAATTFNLFYRPAGQGRKVAYLVVASFLFLVLELGIVWWAGHATNGNNATTRTAFLAFLDSESALSVSTVPVTPKGRIAHEPPNRRLQPSPFQRRDARAVGIYRTSGQAISGTVLPAFPQSEAVLLSTCNRTEFYTASSRPSCCPATRKWLIFWPRTRLKMTEIENSLFAHRDRHAVRHLFSVAASLDSMVIGETQILSQVRTRYQLAVESNQTIP